MCGSPVFVQAVHHAGLPHHTRFGKPAREFLLQGENAGGAVRRVRRQIDHGRAIPIVLDVVTTDVVGVVDVGRPPPRGVQRSAVGGVHLDTAPVSYL